MITFFYRSYIRECNYTCSYCPFVKGHYTEKNIQKDREYFNKLIDYIKENYQEEFALFLAPRGEIMILEHYFEGIARLLKLKNLKNLVVQSNFSGKIEWLKNLENKEKFNLWLSFHPEFVTMSNFVKKLKILNSYGVNYCVGSVGVKENFSLLKELRDTVPPENYMWINAYKDIKNYYSSEDIEFLTTLDPLFKYNLTDYKSLGEVCSAGYDSFFLEYNGDVRRCFGSMKKLGNIYNDNLEDIALKTSCKRKICDCFIGYINLKKELLIPHYKNLLARQAYLIK